ncbi:SDR family NAD(P)-dependent oxidoreductase [Achromobacter xylosoxidans]
MALVTGAARGLGYAIALALGRAGAKVVVNDLSAQACDAACERLNAAGIPARGAVRRGRRRGRRGRAARAGGADGRPTCWSATPATRTASPWSR